MLHVALNGPAPGLRGWGKALVALVLSGFPPAPAAAQGNGCATGAVALANAYVRMNPIQAVYVGQLESYVTSRQTYFAEGADAIRCARALSVALANRSIQAYDPKYYERQDALNTQLGIVGISPGQQPASPSAQLLTMSRNFAWLARVLPDASEGDLRRMYTATTEDEQMALSLRALWAELLQNPMVIGGLQQVEPQIRQLAELEYQMVVGLARQLSGK